MLDYFVSIFFFGFGICDGLKKDGGCNVIFCFSLSCADFSEAIGLETLQDIPLTQRNAKTVITKFD